VQWRQRSSVAWDLEGERMSVVGCFASLGGERIRLEQVAALRQSIIDRYREWCGGEWVR
jgi:hypothetical protein